jgi:uncharacterized SAM-binding protein YcdF (DUF218 family)
MIHIVSKIIHSWGERMAVLIKIIYSLVFPPGIFVILVFGLAIYFYVKASSRKLAYILFLVSILFYLSSCTFIGEKMVGQVENQYTFPSTISGDCIVMLGQGAVADVITVDGKGELTSETSINVITALKLYNMLKIPILLSGGSPDGVKGAGNESQIAKRDLLAMQVPEAMIIMDDKSRTTQENAINSAVLIQKNGFKQPILVTSTTHMARSVELFKKEGVEVLALPTLYKAPQKIEHDIFDYIPSVSGVSLVHNGLKEILGKFQ